MTRAAVPRVTWFHALALLGLGLMVGLLACELGARIWFRRSMDFDMEMWKYATLIKEPDPDPRLAHRHRPGVSAVLMGAEVRTNQFGMRGDTISEARPPGTYRIVLLGDSFTMGWGVAEPDTWARILERRLNATRSHGLPPADRYEVLNLGVGNYNTAQEVALLERVGMGLGPDLVVVGHFINDAEPTPPVRASALLSRSYLAAFVVARMRRLPFGASRVSGYERYYRGLYGDDEPGWLAEQEAWRTLAALSRQTDVPVVVYIFPELHDLSASYPFRDLHGKLLRLGAETGLPVIDLLPAFAGIAPPESLWVSPSDAHPNARANTIIADGIFGTLGRAVAPRGEWRPPGVSP